MSRAIVHVIRHDAPAVRRVSYLAKKGELVGDWIGNDVRLNCQMLMADHHGRGREVRHLVLSLEAGADLNKASFEEVASKFMATFAPNSRWLGAVDRGKTRCTHMHLVVCNSDGEKTLNFSPARLAEMQQLEVWSGGLLESGRRGAILRKLTDAAQIGDMTHEQIRLAIQNGRLAIGRRNRRGEVTSVELAGGRRVRLATIQRVIIGSAEDWNPHDSKAGVVAGMDRVGSGARKDRRRNHRIRSQGEVDPKLPGKMRAAANARGAQERKSPEVCAPGVPLLPKPKGNPRVLCVAGKPQMGRRDIGRAP